MTKERMLEIIRALLETNLGIIDLQELSDEIGLDLTEEEIEEIEGGEQ